MQTILKTKSSVSLKQVGKILGLCLLLLGTTNLKAASGMWTNDFDSVWSDVTNWIDGVVADGAGNTAIFSNELASPVIVNMDSARTLGTLSFIQGIYTLTNDSADTANILTLAGGSKPVVFVNPGLTATVRRTVLAGTDGFVMDGGGQLNLFKENTDSNNVITGSIVFSNGVIAVQGVTADNDNNANTLALNSVTSFTFYNGTLNIQPAPNTSPEYGNVNGSLNVPAGGVGTIVLPVRFSGAAGDNSATIGNGLGGNLTGSGTFNVRSRYVRGNVVGDWSAFTGILDIGPSSANADNTFRYGNPAGYPNANVNFSGATALGIVHYRTLTTNTTIPMGVLSGENALASLVGAANNAAFVLYFDVGAKHTSPTDTATYAGNIVNGAGPAGLIKRGAGSLAILGNSTYTGPTIVSNGVLQIGDGVNDSGAIGSGPITNLSVLVFGRAGALTVQAPITGNGSITNIGVGGTLTFTGTNTYTGPTTVTGGRLIVGSNSRVTSGYTSADNTGFGALMQAPGATLTIASLALGSGTTFDFDLQSFLNPTAAVVTNTGNISLNGNVTVNVTGSSIGVGTITLLKYGSRSGAGSFVLGSLPSQVTSATLNDDTANNRVTLTVNTVFDATRQWVGDLASVWDISNPANLVWRVVGSGQITNYDDGNMVRFDDTTTFTNVNVAAPVSPASVLVNNTTVPYTFSGGGSINGVTGLTKQGANSLTIAIVNAHLGLNRIDAGTVRLGDGITDGSLGTGAISNNGVLLLNPASTVTLGSVISGSGRIDQLGPGTATISGNNTYAGGLTLRPGTTTALNNGNAAGIGGNLLVISATATLGSDVSANIGQITVLTNGTFTAGANRVVNPAIRGTNVALSFDKTALITLNGDISGVSGVISNINTGLLRFNSGGANGCFGSEAAHFVLTAGSSLQNRNGGNINLGGIEGSGILGPPQNANNNTVNFVIGALNTSTSFEGTINDNNTNANNRLTGITKNGTGTLTMNNALLTYFGPTLVSNGVLALVSGSGVSNSTSVAVSSPGVLNVTGLTGGTLFLGTVGMIQTNRAQTLRGNGSIVGNVVLGPYGRLEPGFSIGTLSVSGTVALGATNVMEINPQGSPNADRLTVGGTLTYSGRLIVTNLGSFSGLTNGTHVFQLFSAPTISGTFAAVDLPALPPNRTWDTSQLSAGQLRLVVNINPNPTTLGSAIIGGNTLRLTWPSTHIGWRLQTQVNPVTIGLSTNWSFVAGSGDTNLMNFPIVTTNGSVFYRLVLP